MKNYSCKHKKIISENIYLGNLNRIILILLLVSLLLSYTGCKQNRTAITKTTILYDTVISITLYEKDSSFWIDKCFEEAKYYDTLFSKTLDNSDVYKINHSYNEWVDICDPTMELITNSLPSEDISNGRFSIMCGALTDLWDIKNRTTPPTADEIKKAQELCGNNTLDIDIENCCVRINTDGAKIDLGAVAKGYVADCIMNYLISNGINDGIIQLGGNVLVFGSNPDTENGIYNIGIAAPFSDNGSVIAAVPALNESVVTSGNYQRYFTYNDTIYHHIIDVTTGYPAETNLNSVTIICPKSYEADRLSTICFLLGSDRSIELLNQMNAESTANNQYKAIFIDNQNNIVYNSISE